MIKLTDDSPMPFGAYKGHKMMDVPASYLHWLWTHPKDPMSQKTKVSPVAYYIQHNITVLEREYPDGIWEER